MAMKRAPARVGIAGATMRRNAEGFERYPLAVEHAKQIMVRLQQQLRRILAVIRQRRARQLLDTRLGDVAAVVDDHL